MANLYRSGIDFYDGVVYECNSKYSKFGVARAVCIAATAFFGLMLALAIIASHEAKTYYSVPLVFFIIGALAIAGCTIARALIGKRIKERIAYLESENKRQDDLG